MSKRLGINIKANIHGMQLPIEILNATKESIHPDIYAWLLSFCDVPNELNEFKVTKFEVEITRIG